MLQIADLPLPPSPVESLPWTTAIIIAIASLATVALAAVLIFKVVKKNSDSDKDA